MRTVELARNKWVGILQSFGVNDKYLQNRHTECPFCGGKDRYRFDNKDGLGTWICGQCGSGNGFDFLRRHTNKDFKELAQTIDKIAGAIVERKQKPLRDPIIYLRQLHKESTSELAGTPVEVYLKSRGLGIEGIQNVYYHNALKYFDDGKCLGVFPAMLCRFDDVEGNALTYHATYLTAFGEKADVPCVRKFMRGKSTLNGGAVRLRGAEKILYLAEGVESALSVSQLFNVPCWAVGNAGLLESFEVPQGVESIVIMSDNDSNFTGQKSAYALANKLSLKGVEVNVSVPKFHGDYNDILKSKLWVPHCQGGKAKGDPPKKDKSIYPKMQDNRGFKAEIENVFKRWW